VKVAAIVLAAGRSSRASPVNKLLAAVDGMPLCVRAVDAALASPASEVLVVTGHQAAELERALASRPVRCVRNPDFASGLSSSIAAGLRALPAGVQAALFCLADMPRVRADHLAALIAEFEASDGTSICVPVHGGRRGNPVLWPACDFEPLSQLRGDLGGRRLLDQHAARVRAVPMPDDAVLHDVDTPAALAAHAGLDPDPA
jgi:molybdenum cofactor cytidylyltransferase